MDEVKKEDVREKSSLSYKLLNIVGAVLCVIFIPIIIVNLILIVRSFTSSDKVPSVFGFAPVIVLSNSMYPVFEAGDMIVLNQADPDSLEQGDIICYMVDSEDGNSKYAVTHRIMEIQQEDGEDVFVTQGDANNSPDRIVVTKDQVQGIYNEDSGIRFPGLGHLAEFLQSPVGMVVFILVPLVLFFGWDMCRRLIQSRGSVKREEELQAELERLRAQVGQTEDSDNGEKS